MTSNWLDFTYHLLSMRTDFILVPKSCFQLTMGLATRFSGSLVLSPSERRRIGTVKILDVKTMWITEGLQRYHKD